MRQLLFAVVFWSLAFAVGARADIVGPSGLFSLGSGQDRPNTPFDDRLANIRDYDFLEGYTLRIQWADIDLGSGSYDFSVIDSAISQLQSNVFARKLNLEVLVLTPPQHIQNNASETWEHFKGGTLPVPWDPALQQGHADLINALANHAVFDATVGSAVPLSQHSVLEVLNASIPGISSIRDNAGSSGPPKIVEHGSYDRQVFVDTVAQSVGRNRDAFAEKFGFLGYFDMQDDQDAIIGESLNDALFGRLMSDFNNMNQPTLGFFQELLSDEGPTSGSVLGENLLRVSDDTYIMFQALTSWQNPFRGADKVTSMNPVIGIEHGYETYGATFFELYIGDIDGAFNGALDANGNPYLEDLRIWNQFLTTTAVPEPNSAALVMALAGFVFVRRRNPQRWRTRGLLTDNY